MRYIRWARRDIHFPQRTRLRARKCSLCSHEAGSSVPRAFTYPSNRNLFCVVLFVCHETKITAKAADSICSLVFLPLPFSRRYCCRIYGLGLPASLPTTSMRRAGGRRQPAAAKPPCMPCDIDKPLFLFFHRSYCYFYIYCFSLVLLGFVPCSVQLVPPRPAPSLDETTQRKALVFTSFLVLLCSPMGPLTASALVFGCGSSRARFWVRSDHPKTESPQSIPPLRV